MLIASAKAEGVPLFIYIRSSETNQRWGEFNLTLRLQWWLWSRHPGMSQERWQAGQRVNLPFNRLSTACVWPNSQHSPKKKKKRWRRSSSKKKEQKRERCQIKQAVQYNVDGLAVHTLTLPANLPAKSLILTQSRADSLSGVSCFNNISIVIFACREVWGRRGMRKKKKDMRLLKSVFHGHQGVQRKLLWRFSLL